MAEKAINQVEEVAKEEAERLKELTVTAARSGAYLYPFRGIFYFVSHRTLWKPLASKMIPTMTLGLGVTIAMFVFTYVPQMAIMAFTQGPLAAVGAALVVLSESSTLMTVLSKTFLIDDALIDTFDGTLVSKGSADLVSAGRQIHPGSDPMAKLGKLFKKPFSSFSPKAIIRYLMYLPLNFIPVVGTVVFIILQGRKYGPQMHQRYFQLKGWNASQRDKFVEMNKGPYTGFGVPAVLLEMIPVASIFFAFTNTCGAALWAADMEKGKTSEKGTAPKLRELAEKTE